MKNTSLSSHASALYLLSVLLLPAPSYAFDSGSTGADGVFNPGTDIELTLPPSGIFNFTTIDIPAGVTVTFAKNANNTHVTLLASGDVNIAGTIDVSGGNSPAVNDASQSTDRNPGLGGPGGSDGGYGGLFVSAGDTKGGNGRGIGGGTRSAGSWVQSSTTTRGCGGGGGGFNGPGSTSGGGTGQCPFVTGGINYGTNNFFTLRGGSGGGGAAGGGNNVGSGGGGGGGALLIASSGVVSVSGSIVANGGNSGNNRDNQGQPGGTGGGGSGGAIRIIATAITGEGDIAALKGTAGTVFLNSGSGVCSPQCRGGDGAPGRIKLEAEDLQRTSNTTPGYVFSPPRAIFLPNAPSIRISSVGGISAPANPTGNRDVVIPGTLSNNTLTVEFETTGVPLGTTISLTAKPVFRSSIRSVASTPVSGSVNSGTATADIDLANGENILEATATFDVVASLGQDFSNYAKGEPVEKIKVAANSEGQSVTTFITKTGNEYTWPSNAVALN